MYVSAIPMAAAFYFLWNPPGGLNAGGLFIYMLIVLLAVRVTVSLFDVPNASLAPAGSEWASLAPP